MSEETKQRTDQQRKAIEVYCRELADAFSGAGIDKRAVIEQFKQGVEIPWSQDGIKDDVWRVIQVAILKKESTVDLSSEEVSKVYEVVNRFTAEKFGVSVPFPDRFFHELEVQHGAS